MPQMLPRGAVAAIVCSAMAATRRDRALASTQCTRVRRCAGRRMRRSPRCRRGGRVGMLDVLQCGDRCMPPTPPRPRCSRRVPPRVSRSASTAVDIRCSDARPRVQLQQRSRRAQVVERPDDGERLLLRADVVGHGFAGGTPCHPRCPAHRPAPGTPCRDCGRTHRTRGRCASSAPPAMAPIAHRCAEQRRRLAGDHRFVLRAGDRHGPSRSRCRRTGRRRGRRRLR